MNEPTPIRPDDLPPVEVPLRTFTHCVMCEGKIEPSLAELGSLTCHDCRQPIRISRAA